MGWVNRNTAKRNIMNTAKLDLEIHSPPTVEEISDRNYIFNLIDTAIPVQYREDWIRLTNGLKLPKARKEIIVQFALDILKENGIDKETL